MRHRAVAGCLVAGLTLAALALPGAATAGHRIAVPLSSAPGNSSSQFLAASTDGTKVLFSTNQALVPEDLDDVGDIYQREGGRLTLVSAADGGFDEPQNASFVMATPDLSHVVWQTDEAMLSTDFDNGQPDLYARSGGDTRLVTAAQIPGFSTANPILFAAISSNGSHIVFQTNEGLLLGDFDNADDVYESFNGTVRLLSPGGSGAYTFKGMSADGTRVFMSTTAQLTGDTDSAVDIYENVNGTGPSLRTPGTTAAVEWAGSSSDGTHIFFHTTESLNAVLDSDTRKDVYQRAAGATTLVSTSATAGNGDFDATFQRASADGTSVVFTTMEGLDPADTDGDGGDPFDDIYLRSGGVTTLVTAGETLDSPVILSDMTPDGQHVFWWSNQSFAGDLDGGFTDAWHWDDGTIERISVGAQNDQGDHDNSFAGRSGDLSSFFFQSDGQVAPGDTDSHDDIYERDGSTTRLITPTPAEPCTVEPVSDRCVPKFKGASLDGDRAWFTADENLHPLDGDVVVDDPLTPFDREDQHTTDVYESRVVGTPVVDATDATNPYLEGDPAPIDPDLTVTEATDDIFGATVEVTAGFEPTDVLGFEDQIAITGSLSPDGDTLTLTGRGTAGDFEAALRSVTYSTASETPSGDTRTIEFTVTNGGHTGSDTRSLTVTAVNDAPTLALGTGAGDFAEDAAPAPIAPELDAEDLDSTTLESATVRISDGYVGGEDALAFTPGGGITGGLNPAGDTLSLTGTASVAAYETALRSVTYQNTSDQPSDTPRTFEFVANDGDLDSAPATHAFAVVPAEDLTSIEASDTPLAYAENAEATPIDTGVDLTDPDSGVVSGATVAITGGFAGGQDALGFTDQAGIAGTLNASGDTLTLSGDASVADYVSALRSVTYRNTSEDPSGADRVVTFAVTGGAGSDSRTIDVGPVDDAPVLGGGGGGVSFTEGDGPAPVAPALAVSDVDSATLTSAAVRIDDDYQAAADSLAAPAGPLPGGLTANWDAGSATLTVSGAAPLATYRDVLRGVAFTNGSQAPADGTRAVTFEVSSASATAAAVSRNVTVTPVNDPPSVTLAATTLGYTQGDDPVAVDAALGLTDPDSGIQGASVEVKTGAAEGEDVLEAPDRDDGISVAIAIDEQRITLAGSASVAAYRTALRDVLYSNRSAAAAGDRVIEVQVTDGPDVSAPATRTIALGMRAPELVTAPAISGVGRVGGTLTTTDGVWDGSEPMTHSRQWQRCAEDGTGCVDIDGATEPGYAPEQGDVDSTLRVRVTADNPVGDEVVALSAVTGVIRSALDLPGVAGVPAGATRKDSINAELTGDDGATFTCSLDGPDFVDCETPLVVTGLADGTHTLRVRQHVEGLTSAIAERQWVVDTQAPGAPRLLAGPDPVTAATSATVSFAGSPGERFECAADDADFAACTSPLAMSGLAPGAHTVLVHAVDAAGNVGAPLRVRWVVDPGSSPRGLATSLTLRAPASISRRARSFQVGCALDAGVLDRCAVVAQVRLNGQLRRIGAGLAAPTALQRSGALRVRITDLGRRRLGRAGPGARIRVTGTALQDGSQEPLTGIARLRAR